MRRNRAKYWPFSKSSIDKLPDSPGIYIYSDHQKNPHYVGKSVSVRKRVKQYLGKGILPKTAKMIGQTKYLSFIKADSELAALLLEVNLIKKLQPKYNVTSKDGKSPIYVVITNDKYPRILLSRKSKINEKISFGPFISKIEIIKILKLIRKIFPYATHKITKRPCLQSHLGLCNPCPSNIESLPKHEQKNQKNIYLHNIRMIKSVLNGNLLSVEKYLLRLMNEHVNKLEYEKANKIKIKLTNFHRLTNRKITLEPFLENPNLIKEIREKEALELKNLLLPHYRLRRLKRIECYDVSHLSGIAATASMVTFINGEADKQYYRHFKIRQAKKRSDTDSLKEVINRRLNHLNDWGRPDLVIVDGGKAQVKVFFEKLNIHQIPVIGLAKVQEKVYVPKNINDHLKYSQISPRREALFLLQRLRDEAHRFARRYHHKLVKKNLLVN